MDIEQLKQENEELKKELEKFEKTLRKVMEILMDRECCTPMADSFTLILRTLLKSENEES